MGSISESRTAIDRISNLPNNLITHILSFLSTEDAVRTSTLSTHWNEHWTLATNLDFYDGVLIQENSKLEWNPTPRSETSFVNFVYRVLLAKVTHLDLFRLIGGRDYGVLNVTQWLSIALSRNVREIDLMTPLNGRYFRHDQLFSSSTLVILILGVEFILKVPEIISLESLKVLHLTHLQFEDGESLSRLVSSCLVLRELKIIGKLSSTVKVLKISSPVLKFLILNGLYSPRFSEIHGAHSYEIVLNTPSLQYLKLDDDGLPDGFHIQSTLHYLDEAWLSLQLSTDQIEEYDDQLILARSIQDLAVALSNVRFLDFSDMTFEALRHGDCVLPNFQLPSFPRLTDLDIGGVIDLDGGSSLLTSFLQSSPQLASLHFALEDELESWDPPTNVPSCILHNLKVIEVRYYPDSEAGRIMVKYFLEKSSYLKELIIRMKEKNEEFIKEVSLLPRASNVCKIVIT